MLSKISPFHRVTAIPFRCRIQCTFEFQIYRAHIQPTKSALLKMEFRFYSYAQYAYTFYVDVYFQLENVHRSHHLFGLVLTFVNENHDCMKMIKIIGVMMSFQIILFSSFALIPNKLHPKSIQKWFSPNWRSKWKAARSVALL